MVTAAVDGGVRLFGGAVEVFAAGLYVEVAAAQVRLRRCAEARWSSDGLAGLRARA